MSTELIQATNILSLPEEYKPMIDYICAAEPAIIAGLSQQNKSHTQFQYITIDASGPVAGFTLIRNWRMVLANIERTRDAIEDAALAVEEHEIKARQYRKSAKKLSECLEKHQLFLIKARHEEILISRIKRSVVGAVRKLAAYIVQLKKLEQKIREELKKQNDEPITEADIEADEERFHIMKVFEQALIAFRSLGHVDHGNMIFLHDIGINGQCATLEIRRYLEAEEMFMKNNPNDVHGAYSLQVEWLKRIAARYASCGANVAQLKGLSISALAMLGGETQ